VTIAKMIDIIDDVFIDINWSILFSESFLLFLWNLVLTLLSLLLFNFMFSFKFRKTVVFLFTSKSLFFLFGCFLFDFSILTYFVLFCLFFILWTTAATASWWTVFILVLSLLNFICLFNTCDNLVITGHRRLSK
jgi:hypothetical protein